MKKPEMTYEEYVHNQTIVHGQIEKPEKYAIGERKAIEWFFRNIPECYFILDIGCGTGNGLRKLHDMEYYLTVGVEINSEKAFIGKDKGFDVVWEDINEFIIQDHGEYHVIWSSHSFEHLFDPEDTLMKFQYLNPDWLFLVLPYPDTGDPKAHIGSFDIGTRIDDNGSTVIKWFTDRGWTLIDHKFDDFREPEIWLKLRRDE